MVNFLYMNSTQCFLDSFKLMFLYPLRENTVRIEQRIVLAQLRVKNKKFQQIKLL